MDLASTSVVKANGRWRPIRPRVGFRRQTCRCGGLETTSNLPLIKSAHEPNAKQDWPGPCLCTPEKVRASGSCRFTPESGHLVSQPFSLDFEFSGGLFASIGNDFVFNLLPLIEGAEAGAFDRRDVDEYVLASTTVRLNKTIAFGRVEPLHSTGRHYHRSQS